MKTRALLLSVAFGMLAGCGDSTGPSTFSTGLFFNFTGGGGGTFNVSGTMPTLQANIGNSNWAAAHFDTPNSQTGIFGARARGGGRYDFAFIGIDRLTVGTSAVDTDCDPELESCTGLVFLINVSEADDNIDFICFLATGSVAIATISSTRVTGTFSGSGSCISETSITAFTVADGQFDVPLVQALPQ